MSSPVKGAILAVDLGTTTSSAALVTAGNMVLLKEPASGSWSWPSVVAREGAGLTIGTLAERRKRAAPAEYYAEFKRDIGSATPVTLGGTAYLPQQFASAVLAAFRRQAVELADGPVDRLLVTIPAAYGPADRRREIIVQAGRAAGFTDVELLPEPVAAAYAPLRGEPFEFGDLVLIYDFGGGTFDTALIEITGHGPEVRGYASLDDCGGRDIDASINALIRQRSGDWLAMLVDQPGLPGQRARTELADFCRRVKHQLTDVESVEDFLTIDAPPTRVARTDVATVAHPLLDRAAGCCRQLLERQKVRPAQLAAIVTVGGTTRMPAVEEYLIAAFHRPVRHPQDPDLAVVQGAAAWAARASERALSAVPPAPSAVPLAWDLPEGSATLLRWEIVGGTRVGADTPLATVRAATGAVWTLVAGREGIFAGAQAQPDSTVFSGEWIATLDTATLLADIPASVPERIARNLSQLPAEIRATLLHPVPYIRLKAVSGLARLSANAADPAAGSARLVLEDLGHDDSLRVSAAAAAALNGGPSAAEAVVTQRTNSIRAMLAASGATVTESAGEPHTGRLLAWRRVSLVAFGLSAIAFAVTLTLQQHNFHVDSENYFAFAGVNAVERVLFALCGVIGLTGARRARIQTAAAGTVVGIGLYALGVALSGGHDLYNTYYYDGTPTLPRTLLYGTFALAFTVVLFRRGPLLGFTRHRRSALLVTAALTVASVGERIDAQVASINRSAEQTFLSLAVTVIVILMVYFVRPQWLVGAILAGWLIVYAVYLAYLADFVPFAYHLPLQMTGLLALQVLACAVIAVMAGRSLVLGSLEF